MKKLVVALFAIVSVLSQARAVQQSTFSGSCEWPFTVAQWWAVVEYNNEGIPIRAAGVCCDGSVWARDLLPSSGGPNYDIVRATLHGANDVLVSVSANQQVDFRIIDLRTGNYTSPVYHYSPSGQIDINIATLPTGAYGVAVIQNQTMYGLLTFAK